MKKRKQGLKLVLHVYRTQTYVHRIIKFLIDRFGDQSNLVILVVAWLIFTHWKYSENRYVKAALQEKWPRLKTS